MSSELTLPSSAFAGSVLDPFDEAPSGFTFDHFHRNRMLLEQAQQASKQINNNSNSSNNKSDTIHSSSCYNKSIARFPQATKTGTTICGVLFAGGVVLGADTRATNGDMVAEKNCWKIHYMAPNIYCCGAGTAADTDMTTKLLASQLELLRMDTHSKESRVVTALTLLKRLLFRYQGHIGAAMVLGGCDVTGAHLYTIHPHGSTSKLPYASMGSGSLAAMAVLETSWRENMTEAEAITLVQRAIAAGIFNDSASGSNTDVCVIRHDNTVNFHRNMVTACDVAPIRALIQHSNRLIMRPGLTPVLKTEFTPHPPRKTAATLADVTVTEMEVEGTA